MSGSLAISLRNRLEDLAHVQAQIERFAAAHPLSDSLLRSLSLVVEEILCNVMSHAYEDDAEHEIEVRLSIDAGELSLEVIDDGREFDPLDAPRPDTAAPLEARPIGGLGVHLVRSLMDDVHHERRDGRNILTLRKGIGPAR